MSDLISRKAEIEAMWKALYVYEDLTETQFMEHEAMELGDWFRHRIFVQRMHEECIKAVESLPSAEPDFKDVLGWLLAYHIQSLDLHGRYLPNEVIAWLINDFTRNFIAEGDDDD